MKTVLIVSQKLNGGGAERVASNLSVELSNNANYRVKLALFDGSNQTYPAGCEIIDMGLGPREGKLGKFSVLLKRVAALRKIKEQHHVDVSISLLDSPNFINVLSGRGEKLIVSYRNNLENENKDLSKKMISYTCRKADAVISLSRAVELELVQWFGSKPEKTRTIYNSCDGVRLLELAEQTDTNFATGPFVVTMGRLMHEKGQWHLIRAFSEIHKRHPELKLVILGEGEYMQKLKSLAAALGLKDSVIFCGYIANPHAIIKKAEAFLFTSLYEGLGNALLEAMACGVPIVSVDCIAGPKEILTKDVSDTQLREQVKGIVYTDYGILTEAFSSSDEPDFVSTQCTPREKIFADAVCQLLESEQLQEKYRKGSLKRIQDFNETEIVRQWMEVIG